MKRLVVYLPSTLPSPTPTRRALFGVSFAAYLTMYPDEVRVPLF